MTQQIKLKAKLKAYSKAPFYLDYVRSVNVVNGVEEKLEPNTVYGLKDGQWYKMFLGDVEEVNSRLSSLESVTKNISEDILPTTQRDSALAVQYVKNIKIEEDLDENSIIFTDQYGTPHRIRLQVQVDNKSILYNNYNQLELVNKIDNTTIQEDNAGNMVVNSIHATQLIDGQSQDVYITGDEILSIINALKYNNFIFLDNPSIGDLIQGEEKEDIDTDNIEHACINSVEWYRSDETIQYTDSWQNNNSYLKGNIDENNFLTINGLKERLVDLDETKVERVDNRDNPFDVVYAQSRYTHSEQVDSVCVINISEDNDSSTIVKRTSSGAIKTGDVEEEVDCTNVGWINDKLLTLRERLNQLVTDDYNKPLIDNEGDITTNDKYIEIVK